MLLIGMALFVQLRKEDALCQKRGVKANKRGVKAKVKNDATKCRKVSEIFTNDSLALAVLGNIKPSCSRRTTEQQSPVNLPSKMPIEGELLVHWSVLYEAQWI